MPGCVLWGGIVGAAFAWSALVLLAGLLRPARKHPPAKRPLKFAVVICARNEARVIAAAVARVRAADYPSACRDVIVLADNCADATVARAAAAGATVWEKDTPSRCKGDVLAWGLARLYARGGFDAVAVFDADNLVSPGWFTAMNAALQDGETVVIGRRTASNGRAHVIAGWYATYWSLINEFSNRVRTNLGLSGKITGTGFAFRVSVLEAGRWATRTFVEDTEFTLQVNLAGGRVAYVPEAEYADEQPVACGPMWRQLKRWATGGWQVLALYGWTWLKTLCRRPSLRLFDVFFAPLTGFFLAFAWLSEAVGLSCGWRAAPEALLVMTGTTLVLAALARALTPRAVRPGFVALATFPVFALVLALSVLVALVWPTRRWAPVPHTGGNML